MNQVICADFNTVDIEPGSVDLIFTDPPYVKEGIETYPQVALLGQKVLKSGGFLVVYASDYWFAETFPLMLKYLTYFYLYHHISNQTASIFPRKLWARGKSLLAFSSGKPKLESVQWHNNYYAPPKKEKSHRKDNWEQSVDEAEFFIKNLCPELGLVLDPMCGSGTTLVAAKKLGRSYIGIDQSQEQCDMSLKRLSIPQRPRR
jgi:site-specific DNA-methyltransferase (adenine-specific)